MHPGIASSSLRELDAVALATNVTVFMERDTKVPPTFRRISAAIFLKFLPIVVGGTRLRIARAVQHAG